MLSPIPPPPPPSVSRPVAQVSTSGSDPALRRELLDMEAVDQHARKLPSTAQGKPPAFVDVDRKNHARLVQMFTTSWPGFRRVGADGESAAWVLIQHQDLDRPFQHRCLA